MAFYSPLSWDKKGKGSFIIYFGVEFCINEYASQCTTFPALRNSMPLTQALKCANLTPLLSSPSWRLFLPSQMFYGSAQPRIAQQVEILGHLTAGKAGENTCEKLN